MYKAGLKDHGAGRRTVYSQGKTPPKITTSQAPKVRYSAGKSQPSYEGNIDPKGAPVQGKGVEVMAQPTMKPIGDDTYWYDDGNGFAISVTSEVGTAWMRQEAAIDAMSSKRKPRPRPPRKPMGGY